MQYGLNIEPTLRDSFPWGAQPTATISANPRTIVKRNIVNPSSILLARNCRYVRKALGYLIAGSAMLPASQPHLVLPPTFRYIG